jgi:predicted metal-dependent RNase
VILFFTISANKIKEITQVHQNKANTINQELSKYLFRLDNEPFPAYVRELIKERIKKVIESQDNSIVTNNDRE